jgi:hypothetical protein
MDIDINDQEFIDRFWAAYWQGRLLVQQAFGTAGDSHER